MTEADSVGFTAVAQAVTNCWVCCSLQSTQLSRTRILSEYPSVHFHSCDTFCVARVFFSFPSLTGGGENTEGSLSFSEHYFAKMWMAAGNDRVRKEA